MTNTMPVRLRREPLIEAVWEVRFSSDHPAASELLTGLVLQHLKAKPSDVVKLPTSNIPAVLRERDANLRYVATIQVRGDRYSAGIGERCVFLSSTRPYAGWLEFRKTILDLMKLLKESQLLTRPERFSLKYTDVLSHLKTPSLECLALKFEFANRQLTTEPGQFRFEIERRGFVNGIHVALPATLKVANGEEFTGVVLEIDTIYLWREPENQAAFWTTMERQLDDAHEVNKMIFFQDLLTRDTVDAHEPMFE